MCSRFSDSQKEKVVKVGTRQLHLKSVPKFVIRPTDQAQVVVSNARDLEAQSIRWGFPLPGRKQSIFNARSETVAEKPMFRDAFRTRRCLVPACGFYESMTDGSRKLPVRFVPVHGGPLLFAGLWSEYKDVGRCLTILTTTPNSVVAKYHDRMPVILDAEGAERWLFAGWDSLSPLLVPAPENFLGAYAVTPSVFKPDFQSPEALQPVPAQADLF